MSRRALIDWALIVLVICAAAAVAVPVAEVRPFLVAAAAFIVPGAAALTLVESREPLLAAALAVALSIAIVILGSLVLVWTELWHPVALAIVLGSVSVSMLIADVRRSSP
jgi:hypothetical protein